MHKLSKLFDIILTPILKNIVFFITMFLLGVICIFSYNNTDKFITLFELFFDVYILSGILSLLPRKLSRILKCALYVVLYGLALIDIYCLHTIGGGISPTLLEVFMDTNSKETAEALGQYLSLEMVIKSVGLILLLILVHILLAIVEKVKKPQLPPQFSSMNVANIALCCILIVCVFHSITPKKQLAYYAICKYEEIKRNYNDRTVLYLPVYKLYYSIILNRMFANDTKFLENSILKTKIDSCSFKSPNIVLIIGESHNRHHSQLYGYDKAVSPYQLQRAKEGDLVAFTDVIASYRLTRYSFKNMFSFYCYGDSGEWYNYTIFPVVFKKAGYHVTFVTNQFTNNNDANVIDFADAFFNHPNVEKLSFDSRNTKRHEFDEDLLNDYDTLKSSDKEHNLIIFHLMGQHGAYKERYPQKWAKYSAKDYNRPDLNENERQLIAEYDNSTLYNDYVIEKIIKQFEQQDAIIVYLPDHGEACYDYGHVSGRPQTTTPNDLYQVYDIPFWIYMTKSYQMKHPDIVEQVHQAKDKPFMTDNLGQVLVYLAGISIPEYISENNLLSPDYNVTRKRMIKGEVDYDEIMKDYRPI